MLEECVARVVQLSYDPFWKTTLRIHRHTRTPQEENVQLHPHHKCARGASLHTHTVRPCGDVGHTPGARGTEQCRVCERTGQPGRHLLTPYTTRPHARPHTHPTNMKRRITSLHTHRKAM